MIFMHEVKNIHHKSKCYAQIYPNNSRMRLRMTLLEILLTMGRYTDIMIVELE